MSKEKFISRWGFILAGLGMAIGTGNIWRFPRVVAENGGGAFVIPWMLALFLWSLPLILVEYSLGRGEQAGVVLTFQNLFGRSRGWPGGFIAFVTAAIMFYYSVVTGWCLFYALSSIFSPSKMFSSQQFWNSFISSPAPLLFHFLSLAIVAFIISRGVAKGIEAASKLIIPSLFLLLVVGAVRAITLPGGLKGLDFLFYPDLAKLLHPKVWLEALSQSAWSTGAGWGLILTYAVYSSKKEDGLINSSVIVFGDYTASLLAAMTVVPTIFAFAPSLAEAEKILAAGKTELTFIAIPKLFLKMPAGPVFMFIFFLALFLAALSSFISLFELETRVFMDFGMPRRRAVALVAAVTFLLGVPSALSTGFLDNQDWVWGLALLVNGFIFSLAVVKMGFDSFRKRHLSEATKFSVKWLRPVVTFIIPAEFAVLLFWWFSSAVKTSKWYSPFTVYGLGTVLFQWVLAAAVIYAVFKLIYKGENES